MSVCNNKDNFVCYRNNLSESEIKWKNDQKELNLKNVSEYQEEIDQEEEKICYLKLRNFVPASAINKTQIDDEKKITSKIKLIGTLLSNRDTIGALIICTEILAVCQDHHKYNVLLKRSDSLIKLHEFEKSLKDAQLALELNKIGSVPYFRCVRCYINLGRWDEAEKFLNENSNVFKDSEVAKRYRDDIKKSKDILIQLNSENSHDFEKCLKLSCDGLKIASCSVEFLALKLKYLVILNKAQSYEAKDTDHQIDKQCGKILKLLDSLCSYYNCEFSKCNFDSVGKRSSVFAKMNDRSKKFGDSFKLVDSLILGKNNEYAKAVTILEDLYDCDNSNRLANLKICKLLLDCYSNIENEDENIIKYATEMLKENSNDLDRLIIRAISYVNLEKYTVAKLDLETIMKHKLAKEKIREKAEILYREIDEKLKSENRDREEALMKEKQRNDAERQEKMKKQNAKEESCRHEENSKKAEDFNCRGNSQYKAKQFSTALIYYTDAIKLCPKTVKYYTNRSACHLALGDLESALCDAVKAVEVQPSFAKGYSRSIKIFLELGNITQVKNYMEKMRNNIAETDSFDLFDIDSKVKSLENILEKTTQLYEKQNYNDVLKYVDDMLKISPAWKTCLYWKAEVLIMLKKIEEAKKIMKSFSKGPYESYLEGMLNYFEENFDSSLAKFQEALRFDSEFPKAVECKKMITKLRQSGEQKKRNAEKSKQEEVKFSETKKKAEDFNSRGNSQYKAKQFSTALIYYTDAIKLCPKTGKYYTNRSACHLALGDRESALCDAIKAVEVDPSFWKGYSRAINLFLQNGNISQAKNYIEKLQKNTAGIESIKFNEIPKLQKLETHHENILKFLKDKNYNECLKHLDNALKIASACKNYDYWKAECLIMLEKYEEAKVIVKKFPKDAYVYYLEGVQEFFHENFNTSIDMFREALRLDPEMQKAADYKNMVVEIQKLLNSATMFQNNDQVMSVYTTIISFKHENISLKIKAYVKRAELHFNSQNFSRAFEDCSLALRLRTDGNNENCIKALLLRAKIHNKNFEFEDAMIDCEEILSLVSTNSKFKDEVEKLKKDAKYNSIHRDRRDHYEVLKVPKNAPMSVIKEAFKNLSRLYHSDKHPEATAVEKKKLERKFQEIKTSFECLKVWNEC